MTCCQQREFFLLRTALKPLNWIWRKLIESKISMSSTKFVFFRPIKQPRCGNKCGTLYSGARYVALWASCFDLLGVICHFSIKIRIEVHGSCVNLWDVFCASQDLHMTHVHSFPNANKKSVLQSLNKVVFYESDVFVSNGINILQLFSINYEFIIRKLGHPFCIWPGLQAIRCMVCSTKRSSRTSFGEQQNSVTAFSASLWCIRWEEVIY